MSEVTEQQLEDMEALFVQTAASMTSDRGTITLHGLSPSTLYFADRPQRDVGHMRSSHFVANWTEGDNSFADNPPNAVLSFAEPGRFSSTPLGGLCRRSRQPGCTGVSVVGGAEGSKAGSDSAANWPPHALPVMHTLAGAVATARSSAGGRMV